VAARKKVGDLAEEHPVLALGERDLDEALGEHRLQQLVGTIEHRLEDVAQLEVIELGDGGRVAVDGEGAEVPDELRQMEVRLLGVVGRVIDDVRDGGDAHVQRVEQPELGRVAGLELHRGGRALAA
jgi:hypothetical protein